MRKTYAPGLRQRAYTHSSCERACRCVSDCPRAGRCVRHAQPARPPRAYTCRTDCDLCHWLRSVHRCVYRQLARFTRADRANARRAARSTRSTRRPRLSIYRSMTAIRPDRRSLTPADYRRPRNIQHIPPFYEACYLEKSYIIVVSKFLLSSTLRKKTGCAD